MSPSLGGGLVIIFGRLGGGSERKLSSLAGRHDVIFPYVCEARLFSPPPFLMFIAQSLTFNCISQWKSWVNWPCFFGSSLFCLYLFACSSSMKGRCVWFTSIACQSRGNRKHRNFGVCPLRWVALHQELGRLANCCGKTSYKAIRIVHQIANCMKSLFFSKERVQQSRKSITRKFRSLSCSF